MSVSQLLDRVLAVAACTPLVQPTNSRDQYIWDTPAPPNGAIGTSCFEKPARRRRPCDQGGVSHRRRTCRHVHDAQRSSTAAGAHSSGIECHAARRSRVYSGSLSYPRSSRWSFGGNYVEAERPVGTTERGWQRRRFSLEFGGRIRGLFHNLARAQDRSDLSLTIRFAELAEASIWKLARGTLLFYVSNDRCPGRRRRSRRP